jgi:hypothetical protein
MTVLEEQTLMLAHPLDIKRGGENRTYFPVLRDWLLVTYVLVDDELMKLVAIAGDESVPNSSPPFDHAPAPATVTVVRGFAGTTIAAHVAGARVLSPVSLDSGVSTDVGGPLTCQEPPQSPLIC